MLQVQFLICSTEKTLLWIESCLGRVLAVMAHGTCTRSESWCFSTLTYEIEWFCKSFFMFTPGGTLFSLSFHSTAVWCWVPFQGPLSPASAFPGLESRFYLFFPPLFCTFSPAHVKLLKDCIISVGLWAVCQVLHPFCCRDDPCEEPLDLYTWIYLGLRWRKTPLTSQFSFKETAQNWLILSRNQTLECNL